MAQPQYISETLAETMHILGAQDSAPTRPVIRPALRRMVKALVCVVMACGFLLGPNVPYLMSLRTL